MAGKSLAMHGPALAQLECVALAGLLGAFVHVCECTCVCEPVHMCVQVGMWIRAQQ